MLDCEGRVQVRGWGGGGERETSRKGNKRLQPCNKGISTTLCPW